MTTWSGFVNHLRIGYDVWTDSYNTYTPSINVYIQISVQVDSSWNFNDSQTVNMSGSAGQSWTFQNTMGANGVTSAPVVTIANQGQSYGGGPTYSFHAELDGVYLGAGPAIDFSYTLPARPTRVPNPPGAPGWSSISATQAIVSYSESTDNGGLGIDGHATHVATDSAFNNIIQNVGTSPGGTWITGLAPNTTYWGRDFSHNGDGWSGASGVTSFATNAYKPGAPSWSNILPTTATVSWSAPSSSPAPSQFEIQIATDSGFTNLVKDMTGNWTTSFSATGLAPNTAYYTRVRANSGTGWGVWSSTASMTTLSGAKVRVNGAWQNAPAYARVNGAWQTVTVKKRVNGAWQT